MSTSSTRIVNYGFYWQDGYFSFPWFPNVLERTAC